MMQEIFKRGPIACGLDANPLEEYTTGIIKTKSSSIDHVISVVGWGTDATDGLYWIVRNSWGEYWGEDGYVRVKSGALSLEEHCAWAVPGEFTAPENNNQYHCHEDGGNCDSSKKLKPQKLQAEAQQKSELLSIEESVALGVVPQG